MRDNVTQLVQQADPTIETVLDAFMAEQQDRLQTRTLLRYQQIIELLKRFLNVYGPHELTTAEAVLYRRYAEDDRDPSLTFCTLFGPEKIFDHLPNFLRYFIIEKVIAPEGFKRSAGTVVKRLAGWLETRGHFSKDMANQVADWGAAAVRNIPRAERAAQIIFDATQNLYLPHDIDMKDYRDFDHFVIVEVQQGMVWLQPPHLHDHGPLPIALDQEVTDLLEPHWEISCALARIGRNWRIVEMGSVFPL